MEAHEKSVLRMKVSMFAEEETNHRILVNLIHDCQARYMLDEKSLNPHIMTLRADILGKMDYIRQKKIPWGKTDDRIYDLLDKKIQCLNQLMPGFTRYAKFIWANSASLLEEHQMLFDQCKAERKEIEKRLKT